MCTITLADGTQLKNISIADNKYIANGVISDEVFEDNLSEVVITDGNKSKKYNDMFLASCYVWDGKSCFVLRKKPPHNCINDKVEKITKSLTDIEMALTEIYEFFLNGKS